ENMCGNCCTTLSSSTYHSLVHIINDILTIFEEDDEETRDAKEHAREIICCMMICVNRFWATVKNESSAWWDLGKSMYNYYAATVSPTSRRVEMFKYLSENIKKREDERHEK